MLRCEQRRVLEMTDLDTGYHRRRLAERMENPEFRREYELARAQIAQVDAIMRELDHLREEAGLPKAELARRIGKDPAAVRRLFASEANPELKTIAAMAAALGAEVKVVPRRKRARGRSTRRVPSQSVL
jgi:ribosome-binding protein aMBF1 (putative translation factor)